MKINMALKNGSASSIFAAFYFKIIIKLRCKLI